MCRLRIPNGILNAMALRRRRRSRRALRRRLCRRHDARQPADPRDRRQACDRRAEAHPGSGPHLARRRRRQHPQHHRQPDCRHRSAGVDRHAARSPASCIIYILNHRELYGLPRKFNVAFDGGGTIAVLEDTNDIGFAAVESRRATASRPASISGSRSAASPATATSPATPGSARRRRRRAGRRRRRARLHRPWRPHRPQAGAARNTCSSASGIEKFLRRDRKAAAASSSPPLPPAMRARRLSTHGHIGVHPQRQAGLSYIGVVLPVGRLTASQMRGLADDRRAPRQRHDPPHGVAEPADLRRRRRRVAAATGRHRGARPRHRRRAAIRARPGRLHRQYRLQILGHRHQGAGAAAGGASRERRGARSAGQHPSHRLPALLRAALRRRYRPSRRPRSGRGGDRGLSILWAAAPAASAISPARSIGLPMAEVPRRVEAPAARLSGARRDETRASTNSPSAMRSTR